MKAEQLGEALKHIRIQKGFKPAYVARRAHISRGYYNNIEKGRNVPSFEVLENVARALECSLCELCKLCRAFSENSTKKVKEKHVGSSINEIQQLKVARYH
ncbi:MAG: helix-turn-helix transcriptional regulator [Syntrophothermus sp.]|uniref:helix-turn-helix domain-containing protein n=1 Tax=Syntrophothermus sp. TaxID=2736299 RepID=UPI00257FC11F|nr:helix-turn-helix transcriptional regulator [Syntrophothermus sp.]NSW84399.1 helix-turn-helix transcriptional regulator [Syntrophothermus sp.]